MDKELTGLDKGLTCSDLERHPDWSRRLIDIASVHSRQQAVWGQTDCLMVVGEVIQAVVGVNPLERFRGKYSTELGAAKVLRQNECENVLDVFADFLTLTETNRFQMLRGDVGVVLIQDQYHAGYILNDGIQVKQSEGMITLPLDQIQKAFQIGRR